MKERQALTRQTAKRYRGKNTTKSEKGKILDQYIQDTGYNRKYAIHILTHEGKVRLRRINGKLVALTATHRKTVKRVYPKLYGEAVAKAVLCLWEFFDYKCGKRLVPLVKDNLEQLEASALFGIDGEIREKLEKISVATVERMLKPARKKLRLKGTNATKPGTLLKSQIPIRVSYDFDERIPGFFEIDTVMHDGGFASGEYCMTLTATDVGSGWTEERSLRNKAFRWVNLALDDIKATLPFAIYGMDSDNGGEFINHAMVKWCADQGIAFTRSRSYHKNDNCFVEQKNGDVVRKTVGYQRFQGEAALASLSAVYQALCPLLNYFYPSQKLIAKEKAGGRTKKTYDPPKTPFQRLMERDDLPSGVKQDLMVRKTALNIVDQKLLLDRAVATLLSSVHTQTNRSSDRPSDKVHG
jgi:hypothetical protein